MMLLIMIYGKIKKAIEDSQVSTKQVSIYEFQSKERRERVGGFGDMCQLSYDILHIDVSDSTSTVGRRKRIRESGLVLKTSA